MTNIMWKKQYQQSTFYWGLEPSQQVKLLAQTIMSGRALDIGCGEGRNTLFLASSGFIVDAVDKEKEGIKKIMKNISKFQEKNIHPIVADIVKLRLKKEKYDLVIVVHSIDFLKFSEVQKVIKKIKKATRVEGMVYLSVFSTKDPVYRKIVTTLKKEEIERNTFFLPKMNSCRHFFEVDELRSFFQDWEIQTLEEREITDEHGDSGKHTHHIIELVAKKSGY